jgi:hypothetical protein
MPRIDSHNAASCQNRPEQMQQDAITENNYSISLSACTRTIGGMAMPSPFAAFTFTNSSNFVGRSTGKFDGLAPLRILSTYAAVRRYKSGR